MPATPHLYDITRTLRGGESSFPGDPVFEKVELASGGARISRLSMSSHGGTHLDAPAHVFEDGAGLDSFPVDRFFVTALVVETRFGEGFLAHSLAARRCQGVQAVLLKTVRDAAPPENVRDSAGPLTVGTAEWVVRSGIRLVGTDTASIEDAADASLPVHRVLLGAGVLVLENCDLSGVPEGLYELCCFPLRFENADGAPCRAVLRPLARGEVER